MSTPMTRLRNIVLLAAAALLSTHCAFYRLEQLRNTTPHGTPFQNELSRLYMDFATEGEKGYDWLGSAYFAGKGLQLAYGKDVPPEELADWNIPQDKLPELQKARIAVIAVLTPQTEHDSPTRAAEAQFFFDCWVKYQDANVHEDDISYCRDTLTEVLGMLNAPGFAAPVEEKPMEKPEKKSAQAKKKMKAEPLPPSEGAVPESAATPPAPATAAASSPAAAPAAAEKESSAPAEKPVEKLTEKPAEKNEAPVAPAEKPKAGETLSYAVFFEAKTANLSSPGKAVLEEILAALKGSSNYDIVLRDASDNTALSAMRAETVKKQLVESGISESAIHSAGAAAAEVKPGTKHIEIFLNE